MDEWTAAVRTLLDDTDRVIRWLRRRERERREEDLAPLRQAAMVVYEEGGINSGECVGQWRFVRTSRKLYALAPGVEVQWGRISHRLTVWFRGRRLL